MPFFFPQGQGTPFSKKFKSTRSSGGFHWQHPPNVPCDPILDASLTMRQRPCAAAYPHPAWASSGTGLPISGSGIRCLSRAATTRKHPAPIPIPTHPGSHVGAPPVVACLESVPPRSLSAKAPPRTNPRPPAPVSAAPSLSTLLPVPGGRSRRRPPSGRRARMSRP